jgi:hypothetical protein
MLEIVVTDTKKGAITSETANCCMMLVPYFSLVANSLTLRACRIDPDQAPWLGAESCGIGSSGRHKRKVLTDLSVVISQP